LRDANGDLDRLEGENVELEKLYNPFSLNKGIGEDNETAFGELLENDLPGPEDMMINTAKQEMIEQLLGNLSSRSRYAVEEHFGLVDGERKTLRYIGAQLGITGQAVQGLIRRALVQLQIKGEEFRSFFEP
jgi:RNA polymerase primary sigma factor